MLLDVGLAIRVRSRCTAGSPAGLAETYPALRAAGFGSGVAAALITQRRILPVLDGLDELPARVRPDALAALNAATTADDPLILTCRTAEYEAAIAGPRWCTS